MNRDLLTRYFTCECTEEEKASIKQWLDADAEHERIFIRERIAFDASLMIDDDALQPRSRVIRWKALAVAASIAVVALCSAYYLYSPKKAVMQTAFTAAASRSFHTMPDGSTVWLNSGSTLHFPNIFDSKRRVVELDGEGWFEVATDRDRPFIVRTAKYNVEATGTVFNVEAYSGSEEFAIALFDGAVRLYNGDNVKEAVYLKPGQTAALTDGELNVTANNVNNFRWRDGVIVIEDKSFVEIMQTLEKYYGQKIIIRNDRVKDLGYRGKFRIVDGVEHALRALQHDFRFSYTREEDGNIIYIN